MAKREQSNHTADTLKKYDAVIAILPGVERKGAAIPYTSCNGHMFSQLDPDGSLVLRLPADEIDAFLKKYRTKLHEAHGIVRKEYVVVPERLFRNTAELRPYFASSFSYVASLKPKPSTKAKSTGKKKISVRTKKASSARR